MGARMEDGALRLELRPQPEVLHHGIVRASVLSFLVDAAAGIPVDDDPDVWMLTTDMSVRTRPLPAPERLDTAATLARRGGRAATSTVEITSDRGEPFATGVAGFARVRRRADGPTKPMVTPEDAAQLFRGTGTLSRPLREEAGIEVVDARAGIVQVAVTPDLQNPAGTMQGAMVALVAEAAAEDLVSATFGVEVVVVDLDLRYLARTSAGPVRTRARLLGDTPDEPVEVELVDLGADQLTTHVYARAVPVR
jgi:acyl-coenzyme A thioesterase PaaI-like protein